MKAQYQVFLKFLIELTDIQIKKYLGLARIGVGPDAEMNAQLVKSQVDEMLTWAADLMSKVNNQTYHKDPLEKVFLNVEFYLEQEFLRGHAAWLIDENNIHNPEYERLQAQMSFIKTFRKEADIHISLSEELLSLVQKQVRHDSHAIAYLITNTVYQLRTMGFDKADLTGIPQHARNILKKHAQPNGRYHASEIYNKIVQVKKQTNDFLKNSSLEKSCARLEFMTAKSYAEEDRKQSQNLVVHYQAHFPNTQFTFYQIGSSTKFPSMDSIKPKQTDAKDMMAYGKRSTFFKVGFITVSVIIILSTFYATYQNKHLPR